MSRCLRPSGHKILTALSILLLAGGVGCSTIEGYLPRMPKLAWPWSSTATKPAPSAPGITDAEPEDDADVPPENAAASRFFGNKRLVPIRGKVGAFHLLRKLPPLGEGYLLSVHESGRLIVWVKQKPYLVTDLDRAPEVTALSPNGKLLAYGADGVVTIVDLVTLKELLRLDRVRVKYTAMSFDTASESLLIGAGDSNVYRWRFKKDMETTDLRSRERLVERYIAHGTVVSAVAPHPTGRVFFSGDWKGNFLSWLVYSADPLGGEYDINIFGGRIFSEGVNVLAGARTAPAGEVSFIGVTPDGLHVILADALGVLELWQIRGFRLVGKLQAHRGKIYDMAVAPSGNSVALAGRDGRVTVWKLERAVEWWKVKRGDERPGFVKLADLDVHDARKVVIIDDKTLLVGTESGGIRSFDLELAKTSLTDADAPADLPLGLVTPRPKNNFDDRDIDTTRSGE